MPSTMPAPLPTPGLYQHFKGAPYRVLGVARHSETQEQLVVYQALYGEFGLWVRPLSMFTQRVMHEGKEVPRFEYLGTGDSSPTKD